MPTFQDKWTFRVDFNNVDANGYVKGTLVHGSGTGRAPKPRDEVLLRDWEGNRCSAWVQRVRGRVVYFIIDDRTWASGDEDVAASGTVASAPTLAIA